MSCAFPFVFRGETIDTIERYIEIWHPNDVQITVEDALREVGASLEFPKEAK